MAARRSWNGATRTASTSSLACPATSHSTALSIRPPTIFAPGERSTRNPACAASSKPVIEPNHGKLTAVPVLGSRPPRRASTSCFVVTSIETGSAEHIYETLYCARGQAENPIKLHKAQLASDRTSCRSPLANQMRLILHTAAYWLMLTVRDTIPKGHALATAEFATIRLRLLKLGARVIEMASRVRLAFAAACPDATLIRHIAAALMPAGP